MLCIDIAERCEADSELEGTEIIDIFSTVLLSDFSYFNTRAVHARYCSENRLMPM